ncbi:hypothetical protein BDY21DRAFT_350389 [Lineolata rhizophorae]|uniref:Thioredoxin domain-containing protein n=1 Tax=Lineolata rhizophorae TaxID=578093 RepID=A0A6A6NU93_9PEZI|nr:hypothetical protein BDY21DRAFT_350389 [Lineolata rhizophorae]
MAAHQELNSKTDFENALQTKGKYVLIYCYSGEVPEKAEAAAKEHADTTDAFKVDVDKYATAKEYFNVEVVPTVAVYKDGKEIKRVEGLDEAKTAELSTFLKSA